jgi:hypothetical protein
VQQSVVGSHEDNLFELPNCFLMLRRPFLSCGLHFYECESEGNVVRIRKRTTKCCCMVVEDE